MHSSLGFGAVSKRDDSERAGENPLPRKQGDEQASTRAHSERPETDLDSAGVYFLTVAEFEARQPAPADRVPVSPEPTT